MTRNKIFLILITVFMLTLSQVGFAEPSRHVVLFPKTVTQCSVPCSWVADVLAQPYNPDAVWLCPKTGFGMFIPLDYLEAASAVCDPFVSVKNNALYSLLGR